MPTPDHAHDHHDETSPHIEGVDHAPFLQNRRNPNLF